MNMLNITYMLYVKIWSVGTQAGLRGYERILSPPLSINLTL